MEFTTQLLLIYNKDIVWLKVIQTNKEISLYICNNFYYHLYQHDMQFASIKSEPLYNHC